ncbi:uncharacterized protein LOC129909125 [Episyrphus balteatus]|uniref:uncharacterized protein LOC129909125 n=1 Tax=Episyrphus balteatus TaxID=286459 RepID=UPI002486016B|nr:uncharacterized protein LOC129909125 [Episyrphus balteatus]
MKCYFSLRKSKFTYYNIKLLEHFFLIAFLTIIEIRTGDALVYTGHSAYGCFVAIAVPLNIPHHNAFVSYNFETAYGLPKTPKELLPDFAVKEEENEKSEVLKEGSRKIPKSASNSSQNNEPIKENSKSLISKRAIYQMFQDKLKISGLKGEACLLKLVCEINSSKFGAYNGVLGTILHILISPSSSKFENIPTKFYKAELNGAVGNCLRYEKNCSYNLLDIFSISIEDFLINVLSK